MLVGDFGLVSLYCYFVEKEFEVLERYIYLL